MQDLYLKHTRTPPPEGKMLGQLLGLVANKNIQYSYADHADAIRAGQGFLL